MARATPIILTEDERIELERLIRSHSTPQQLSRRARMIVLLADGAGVGETADELKVWRKGVSTWRARWLAAAGTPVVERLSDAPRSGAPARITAEQICAIVALACEEPEASDLPFTHWSEQALANEAMRRGIVDRISQRSVGRILKRSGRQAASHPLLVDAQARSRILPEDRADLSALC